MENTLNEYYDTLVQIRKYLIKKGKSRYSCKTTTVKLEQANEIVNECEDIILNISDEEKGLFYECTQLYSKIRSVYTEITSLCVLPSSSDFCSATMEFDLKSACSLIPVMDGEEATSKKMIDAVEMYAGMLNETGKSLLITFVLKSRLSENAKLRILTQYTSVSELIKDLKKHLLVKKSFTAIQARLQQATQGSRTIDQYGSYIEKLFTDLTISQSDDNPEAYGVLKPLNEKTAIKRFSDGLRSSRLSTIIAARNYSSLSEAIQAAKDEETMSTSSSEVLQFSATYNRGRSNNFIPQRRGYSNYNRTRDAAEQNSNDFSRNFNNYNRNYNGRGRFTSSSAGPQRGNMQRGHSSFRGNYRNQRNVFTAQEQQEHSSDATTTNENESINNQFFRD